MFTRLHAALLLAFLLALVTASASCDGGGNTNTSQNTPTPATSPAPKNSPAPVTSPSPGGSPSAQKTCSAKVTAAANAPAPSECLDCADLKNKTITKPCSGDVCPLKNGYLEGCPALDAPVSPNNKCTLTLTDITACK